MIFLLIHQFAEVLPPPLVEPEEPLVPEVPEVEPLDPDVDPLVEADGMGSQAGNRTTTLYTLSGSCSAASATEAKLCSSADFGATDR